MKIGIGIGIPGLLTSGSALAILMAQAAFDFDFASNTARISNIASLLTTSRSGVAYADNTNGVWTAFAANTPRITDKGMLVEETRTNSVRNSAGVGAVPGTPGTIPTNWNVTSTLNGVARTIVGVGVENGIDYVDIRYSGTASASGQMVVGAENNLSIAAVNGDVWTASAFVRLVAGDLGNLAASVFSLSERDGSGANLASQTMPFAPTSAWQRLIHTRTFTQPTAAFIFACFALNYASGTVVDFTLRVGWSQWEKGAFATSPIRTTSVAVTRGTDVIDFITNVVVDPAYTLYASIMVENPGTGKFPGVFGAQNVDSSSRVALYYNGTTLVSAFSCVDANVAQADFGAGSAMSIGVTHRSAARVAANNFRMAYDGILSALDTAGTVPTAMTKTAFGRLSGSTNILEGWIRRAFYLPTPADDATLQTITASAPPFPYPGATLDIDFVNNRINAGAALTVSHNSGYADDVDGNWSLFGLNVPRITNKGLTVEEARTNSIRNNSMQGAVPGSPGTLPTNWVVSFGAIALNSAVVGVGTELGVDYVDIRVFGTTAAGGAPAIFYDTSTAIAAIPSQAWANSFFMSVVGGSLDNIVEVWHNIYEYDASFAFLRNMQAALPKTGLASSLRRFSFAATTGISTAFVRPGFFLNCASAGLVVDVTLRVGWPQLEVGIGVTTPIRTTSIVATRSADVVSVVPPAALAAYTQLAVVTENSPVTLPANQTSLQLDAGSVSDRLVQFRGATTGPAQCIVSVGGVTQAGLANAGTFTTGVEGKHASGLMAGASRHAMNGVVVGAAPAAIPSAPTRWMMGSTGVPGGSRVLKKAALWNSLLSDIQLASITV